LPWQDLNLSCNYSCYHETPIIHVLQGNEYVEVWGVSFYMLIRSSAPFPAEHILISTLSLPPLRTSGVKCTCSASNVLAQLESRISCIFFLLLSHMLYPSYMSEHDRQCPVVDKSFSRACTYRPILHFFLTSHSFMHAGTYFGW
jgi:hypothetical protein